LTDERNNSTSFKAFIDRVENGLAVIVASDDGELQFDVPLDRLPSTAKAGDHLTVSFHFNADSAEATLRQINELQRELAQSTQPDNFKL
jgi:hypothetical protein